MPRKIWRKCIRSPRDLMALAALLATLLLATLFNIKTYQAALASRGCDLVQAERLKTRLADANRHEQIVMGMTGVARFGGLPARHQEIRISPDSCGGASTMKENSAGSSSRSTP